MENDQNMGKKEARDTPTAGNLPSRLVFQDTTSNEVSEFNQKTDKIKKYLKDTLRTNPFGLTFSESGIRLLCQRYQVTENELRELIKIVEGEAAGHGK